MLDQPGHSSNGAVTIRLVFVLVDIDDRHLALPGRGRYPNDLMLARVHRITCLFIRTNRGGLFVLTGWCLPLFRAGPVAQAQRHEHVKRLVLAERAKCRAMSVCVLELALQYPRLLG